MHHVLNVVLNPCTVARSARPILRSNFVSVMSLRCRPGFRVDGKMRSESSLSELASRRIAKGGVREWYAMFSARFHARGRDGPYGGLNVNLTPGCAPRLTGPRRGEHKESET